MSTPDSNAGTGTGSNGNYHPGPIPPPELGDIQALVFDVFGTVSDWRTGVVKRLAEVGRKSGAGPDVNWNEFVAEWRMGYMIHTRRIAEGGEGPTNTDELHRQLLDDLLDAPTSRWSHLSSLWGENERQQLVLAWHDLDGWPDSTRGLYELKKHYLLSALSNGSVRLLVDMAKYGDFPWDAVFSTEMFDTYKPNPRVYLSVAKLLNLPPNKCAMVAAHFYDCRAAQKCGYRTIYVRRPDEDAHGVEVKVGGEGGVDLVVDSLTELAEILKGSGN